MTRFAPLCFALLTSCPALASDGIFSPSDWVVETPQTLTIYVDLGGSIDSYGDRIDDIPHKAVRIVGTCESSCTMFLGLPNVCIADSAILGFHGPSSDTRFDDPVYMRGLAYKIAARYPQDLKQPFLDRWSRTQRMTWFTGPQVRAMVPQIARCE